jgi:cytochrome c551/c552
MARPVEEVARGLGLNEGAAQLLLDSAREKLRKARELRVRPGRDEKVLTSWNALMVSGMAHAARVSGRKDWLTSARAALDFIRHTMWKDGKLLATAKDGKAHLDAYLDDHAYLLAALLEVMQADFDARDLAWAEEIGHVLLDQFYDAAEGGFFFTSHQHEQLIHRPKPGPDNATPSGNAVAAWALQRLAFLTGETRFSDAAAATIALFWPQLQRQPAGVRRVARAAGLGLPARHARPAHPFRPRGASAAAIQAGRGPGQRLSVRGRYLPAAHPRARGIAREAGFGQNAAFRTIQLSPNQEPRMKKSLILAAIAMSAAHASAFANEEMAKKYACTACHAIDKKLVGPAYKEVAAKYRNDKAAEAKLIEKVKKGGVGVWGQVPMPPNAQVPDEDVKKLVKWVLSLK